MASYQVSVRSKVVSTTDGFGRFVAAAEAAAVEAVDNALDNGRRTMRSVSPSPKQNSNRPGTLRFRAGRPFRDSWEVAKLSAVQGFVYTDQPSLFFLLSSGSPKHNIHGKVNFFWEREGRDWVPGDNFIKHPGFSPYGVLRRTLYRLNRDMYREAIVTLDRRIPG